MSEPSAIENIKKKLPANWFYWAAAIFGVVVIVAGILWYLSKRRKKE